jgi:hypothetical protein
VQFSRLLLILFAACHVLNSVAWAEPSFDPLDIEFFEKRVRPILAERCYECHSRGKGKKRGELVLDDRAAVLRGGDSGPAAVAGDVEKSLLVEAIRYDPAGLQMPPAGKLPQAEIDTLVEWVKRGLPHPSPAEQEQVRQGVDLEAGRRHWAFQPIVEQSLLNEIKATPSGNRIDLFLEAKRQQYGLRASPRADARTLLRRASFDLIGLPPTALDIETHLAELDKAGSRFDEQYAAYIDRLLASPHYGERWGRYWLDLARYADVTESWREGEGQPWRYRDWVVRAWNEDLPYDEFVRRQLAADLLPNADPADNAALGYLGLSPTYWKELKLDHQVIKQVVAEEWEERLDAIGSTFLGLTIGCARCHDHKFDPITTQDYYALAGVLASVREADRPLIPPEQAAPALAARAQVKAIEAKLKPLLAKKPPADAERAEIDKLQAELATLRATPHFDLPLACGVTDAALHVVPAGKNATRLDYRAGQAQDVSVHIRGNPSRTGPVVPRRFVTVLASDSQAVYGQGSGRLELARSLTVDAAPLAARVIVNRVWKLHFGRGIVETPSNFGLQGAPPSHRELLDDVAARFVAHGWSLKWLHRELMTSDSYQQSSYRDPQQYARDPENQWLWRMTPRRLDVEAWRDSLLSVTQQLDEGIGGPPLELAQGNNHRRTIYGIVRRREISELLRLFDFPDPVAHTAQRDPTITPLQQLFVLNSSFFQQQTRALTAQLAREAPATADRFAAVYQTLFQRPITKIEQETGTQFIDAALARGIPAEEAWRQYVHVLLASNEFLFID